MPRRGDAGCVQIRMTVDAATARRIRETFAMNMWGYEHGDMTFQEACARNDPKDWTVSAPERRAVALLGQLCDPERVLRYLSTGMLYARGNATGTQFCLCRISPKVLELDHRGAVAATWCIHANRRGWNPESWGSGARVPVTDEVIVLKNLIEGEEAKFRLTGNRSAYRPQGAITPYPNLGFGPPGGDYVVKGQTPSYKSRGVCDPHRIDFMGGMQPVICPELAQELLRKQQGQSASYIYPGDDPAMWEGVDAYRNAGQAHGGLDDFIAPGYNAPLGGSADQEGGLEGKYVCMRATRKLDLIAERACNPDRLSAICRQADDDDLWEVAVEAARRKIEVSIL